MKYIIVLLLIFLTGCAQPITQDYINDNSKFEIVAIPFIKDADTTLVHELRFYKIKSARQIDVMMRKKFGKWDEDYEGKYQENINRHLWQEVQLLEDQPAFVVITDGTETKNEHFTAVMVFDSKNKDCLTPTHPLRKTLISYFNVLQKKYKSRYSTMSFQEYHKQ